MEWVETTAKSVDEAKDLALDRLGVDESEAEFEILEEPRQGLFGRTRGEARVRARVAPKAPRSKDHRRDRRRRRKAGGSDRSSGRAETGNASNKPGTNDAEPEATDNQRDAPASADQGGAAASATGATPSRGRDGKRSDGRKPRSGGGGERPQRKDASMEEVRTCVQDFLDGLVDAFGIDTPVSMSDDDDEIMATIEGKHGLLLGPKARTLDAIQELTRVTAQRTAPSSIRIKVDVGGYREARRAALVRFASEAAERATAEGAEVVLEPMSAADRKIVHDALNDIDGVHTRSDGADPRRYVVVIPDAGSDAADTDGADEEE